MDQHSIQRAALPPAGRCRPRIAINAPAHGASALIPAMMDRAMSCNTIYLYRAAQGPWLGGWEKYGHASPSTPAEARRLCQGCRDLRPVGPDSLVEPWLCRGLLLDERERRLRAYLCHGSKPQQGEAASRRYRADRAFTGWDADYAFGGGAELAALAGVVFAETHQPPPLTLEQRLVPHLPYTWDPAANVARFHQDEPWTGEWLMGTRSLLSVVEADGRVHDLAFGDDEVLTLLQAGPLLLDALRPLHPCPSSPSSRCWPRG